MDEIIDLSIIIPCHNLEEYITPLLTSFTLMKTEPYKVEYIFVLDDCTDHTEEIIHSYMNPYNYSIYTCNVHSCGLARNIGFEHSQGNYIWFVDGDDWIIYYSIIPEVLDLMQQTNIPIIKLNFTSNYFKSPYFSMVWQYIFKRDLIKDISFTEIQPQEDNIFMKEVVEKLGTNQVHEYVPTVYYYNYLRPDSNMTKYLENSQKEKNQS